MANKFGGLFFFTDGMVRVGAKRVRGWGWGRNRLRGKMAKAGCQTKTLWPNRASGGYNDRILYLRGHFG